VFEKRRTFPHPLLDQTTMSIYRHVPNPPLDGYIDFFWYYVDFAPDHDREHVLPDGTFELIINLQDTPRKLFSRAEAQRYACFKRGWISGAQSKYLVIDALQRSSMIGAHFKPGGAARFFSLPADELANQVVELDSVWGQGTWHWRDQLLAAPGPRSKFRILEQLLFRKLSENCGKPRHQNAVYWALDRYLAEQHLQTIGAVSEQLGFSHKHFIDLFRRETGLTPKLFCRIRRFQQVLVEIQTRKSIDWADIACSCGYFDQSHFVHDFLNFSGLNPSRFLDHRLAGERNFIRAA
jgi:AraC-like DNA-binding protein